MNDFNIRGTRRLVAYELLTYWQPGGDGLPERIRPSLDDGSGPEPHGVVQRPPGKTGAERAVGTPGSPASTARTSTSSGSLGDPRRGDRVVRNGGG